MTRVSYELVPVADVAVVVQCSKCVYSITYTSGKSQSFVAPLNCPGCQTTGFTTGNMAEAFDSYRKFLSLADGSGFHFRVERRL
jgi:hypothetical protein